MNWFWNKKTNAIPGLCSVEIHPDGVGLAHIVQKPGELPEVLACEFVACTEQRSHLMVLTELVERHALRGAACSWVLLPGDYKLLSLEMLPVPKAELMSALQWRIKDLIDFPVTEAAIDYFEVPVPLGKNAQSGLYAVVAHTLLLQSTATMIEASGLFLQTIDIPELALRNILALFPESSASTAFLMLEGTGSQLVVAREANIYFARQLDLMLEQLLGASEARAENLSEIQQQILEGLGSELQRSFDYYRSQLRQTLPSKCYINISYPLVIDYLAEKLSFPIEGVSLNKVLRGTLPATEHGLRRCLYVIGAALRDESTVHATH